MAPDDRRRRAAWFSVAVQHNAGMRIAIIDTSTTRAAIISDGLRDAGLGDLVLIDEVYVSPEARELGFGDELLAIAIAAARERGARTLDALALPGDRNTKNLYERAGIKARLITVSTPLD